MAENARLIRKWFEEVWNQGREETVDAMCAKDVIGHGQAQHGADIRGPEHFKQFMRGFRGAFSDIHIEIHDTIEQGDIALTIGKCGKCAIAFDLGNADAPVPAPRPRL